LRKDIDTPWTEKAQFGDADRLGVDRVENKLNVGNLYNPDNIAWLHHVTQALRATTLYKRDVNYLIEDGEVIIATIHWPQRCPVAVWSTACTRQ